MKGAMRLLPVLGALLLLLIVLFLFCRLPEAASILPDQVASSPPRGWNSYDSYSWIINEEDFLANAEVVSKRLLRHGYEYVVVDFLWYRRLAEGSYTDAYGFDNLDEWGRVTPDPERWPSSRGGKGFTDVARRVHEMGLKFGIHAMRGISAQAVDASTPILDIRTGSPFREGDRLWNAKDIGMRERACAWMPHGFMSVNTNLAAGKAFLHSLYRQYADWGVDFVKLDCVFGEDLDAAEIVTVSEILSEIERPIVFSLSPGKVATPAMAEPLRAFVNMYRITADDWDSWNDVKSHFDVSRDFAASHLIGADGLHGRSWPDLDMLPLGWLTDPGVNQGPHRRCRLTPDEQKTQITLWSMAKSPLIFGGDLKNIDESTFNVIINPTILEINSFSKNNMEFFLVNEHMVHRRWQHSSITGEVRDLDNLDIPDNRVVSLTSCEIPKAKGWHKKIYGQNGDLICWKDDKERNRTPFCLSGRQPLLATDEELIYKERYEGNLHLVSDEKADMCLDASSSKITSSVAKSGSISPCKWCANQMWSLNNDGTLTSNYSGLCATVKTEKGGPDADGIRSWIASGRKGEVYFAIFNLNPTTSVASAKVVDMANAIHATQLSRACNATEIWSGKSIAPIGDVLSIQVNGHGCALFTIVCG